MTGTRTLYTGFRDVARDVPDADAVIGYDGTAHSYAALLDAVDAAAARLGAERRDGEVLGLKVDDPFTFLSLYLAAARLDIVTVLLDSRLGARETARSTAKYDIGRLAVDRLHAPGGFGLDDVADASLHRERARNGYEDEDFVVHCTSGSTGEPKGIVMSQAAIRARIDFWTGELRLERSDIVLCALPLAHCHGIDVLALPTLLRGATVVFVRGGRLTARGFARAVRTHGVTLVSGLPHMYETVTESDSVSPASLSTLRLAVSASAPLATRTQEQFLQRFGLPLRQAYGLSEIGVICFDRAYAGRGSVGLPIAGVQWRLAPLPGDEPLRELYVRGPALARGYYRDAAATAEMFEDGWLRTRDFVHAEADGWYIRGRRSGFINVAGNKVGPLEVEAALRDCAGVREGAVVGIEGAAGTELVAALIVAGSGFELGALRRELSRRLLAYQLPERYEIVSALPRTALGKTDYAAVRRIMQAEPVPVA